MKKLLGIFDQGLFYKGLAVSTLILVSITSVQAEQEILEDPTTGGGALATAVVKHRDMIVTANPLATKAGEKVLKSGGTAADAMIAAQAVLSLVEPQASGIGGGAFVVYYDAKTNQTITVDAREKAPASATEERFQNAGGFLSAWQSGLSVGVPGVPKLMEFMHQHYGKKTLKRLFRPAIRLAKKGYAITERTQNATNNLLSRNISCEDRLFLRDPVAFAYYAQPDCTAKLAGTIVKNPEYANTLKAMADKGSLAFYSGPIAADIVDAVQNDLNIPGDMTLFDLVNYNVVVRKPVCQDYRGYDVCGMGPPSSGALAVGQILGILENFEFGAGNPLDEEMVHLYTQAMRLAFADRGRYVADADFVRVPVDGMLDKAYLKTRAQLIKNTDMGKASPGVPPGKFNPLLAGDPSTVEYGTSHIAIIDRYGNALSMTSSVENVLGNGVMVRGFMLNNQLTDFSFKPVDSQTGLPIANRVQPNKRPRSSMSPTIVFKGGEVEIVTGSPGGSRIISYTTQSIINMIDFGMDPQQAINVPHYMNRNGRTDLEIPIPGVTLDYDVEALANALKARGHSDPSLPLLERKVGIIEQVSGLSVIQVKRNPKAENEKEKVLLIGGADKRRDGTVGGQ